MDREIGTSVAKNTTVMLGAQGITWISTFILLMFLPRYLGSADFGRLYLAISFAIILDIIIDFGGTYLIPKEISRKKDKTPYILVSYIGVRTIIWFICMAILLLFTYFVEYSDTVQILIIILGISKLWEGAVKAIRSCFQGHEMMEYPSVGVIAEKIFVSAVAVTALVMGAGSTAIAVIMAFGVVINLAISLKFMPHIVDKLPKFKIDFSFDLVKNSVPYFLWSIFAVIYYRIDAIMLSTLTTENVVGWYGGAYRFFDIVMFLPSIFSAVLFPIFAKLSESGDKKLLGTFQRSLKYMILAGIPIAILFFFFAENIIQLFYGVEEYAPSIVLLQIFAPCILIVYIDFIFGSTILATDRQRIWAGVGFTAILLNVGLNYLMIPTAQDVWANGGIGAAFATLITELFILISAITLIPRRYFTGFVFSTSLKTLISGGVMAGLIWIMHGLEVFWLVQVFAGLIVYLGISTVSGLVSNNELLFLKEFFSRKNFLSMLTTKREQI